MKNNLSRLTRIAEFDSAPNSALFNQDTLAAIRDCSIATIERDRWAGIGVPFVKMGRSVRYRKSDICAWLAHHTAFQSTTQAQIAEQAAFCAPKKED